MLINIFLDLSWYSLLQLKLFNLVFCFNLGIGRDLVIELTKGGAHVIALSLTKSNLEKLQSEVRKNFIFFKNYFLFQTLGVH